MENKFTALAQVSSLPEHTLGLEACLNPIRLGCQRPCVKVIAAGKDALNAARSPTGVFLGAMTTQASPASANPLQCTCCEPMLFLWAESTRWWRGRMVEPCWWAPIRWRSHTSPSLALAVKFALFPTGEPQSDGAATRIQSFEGQGQPLSFLVFEQDRNFQTLSTDSVWFRCFIHHCWMVSAWAGIPLAPWTPSMIWLHCEHPSVSNISKDEYLF